MFTTARYLLGTALLAFGPPSIEVQAIGGTVTPPTPGAAFVIRSEHHHDAYPLTPTARAEGMLDGRRVSQVIQLRPVPGREATWTVTQQWQRGQPWVLVFSVEQGERGKYGVAAALVRIAADGRVVGIETLRSPNPRGGTFPRAAEPRDVEAALTALTRGT
jgi:hypothetical protein